MPAPTDCLAQIQACALRVCKLDPSGVPLPGANSMVVSNALATLAVSPQFTDGTEIEEVNACGDTLISYRGRDSLKWYNLTLTILTPDPWLTAFLSGGSVLNVGDRYGYAGPEIGPIAGDGLSIEVWSKRVDEGEQAVVNPYAWWVYPRVRNLRPGDYEHSNTALKPQFQGQAFGNPNWFDGPLNDWDTTSDRPVQWFPDVTIPTPQCGPINLAAS